MSNRVRSGLGRAGMLLAVVAVVVGGVPGMASAHGVHGTGESVSDFVWSGFTHMLLGWDHLLFVAGVVLLAGQVRRAAKLITLFAVGHSATLIAATLAGWQISAAAVDVVIALSLVFVGVVGWIGRPTRWGWFAVAVFGFGLVHGLGLSTRLQAVGLPDDGVLARVIGFNVGVELGQLLAVVAVFMLGDVVRGYLARAVGPQRWASAPKVANAALILVGVVAATALAAVSLTDQGQQPAEASTIGDSDACQVRERTETYPFNDRVGHPSKQFFEPDEQAPLEAFAHVIGDGYVIVHYPPSLPTEQLGQLRTFVDGPDSGRMVAGVDGEQAEPLKAVHAYETLVCAEFDLTALEQFSSGWFSDPRSDLQ